MDGREEVGGWGGDGGVEVSDSPWSEQVFPHSSQRCNEYITQIFLTGIKLFLSRHDCNEI